MTGDRGAPRRSREDGNLAELVSEVSAPLSAAKWCNAKRNNDWMRYDIRLSETLLTPNVVLDERGQSLRCDF